MTQTIKSNLNFKLKSKTTKSVTKIATKLLKSDINHRIHLRIQSLNNTLKSYKNNWYSIK